MCMCVFVCARACVCLHDASFFVVQTITIQYHGCTYSRPVGTAISVLTCGVLRCSFLCCVVVAVVLQRRHKSSTRSVSLPGQDTNQRKKWLP